MEGNETGICVPSKDPLKLAEAIAEFLEQPEEVRKKGEHARKRFEQYHAYDVFIEHTVSVYRQALSERTQ
jgi:glycosyltransferase involved in cell wall biosynthesis